MLPSSSMLTSLSCDEADAPVVVAAVLVAVVVPSLLFIVLASLVPDTNVILGAAVFLTGCLFPGGLLLAVFFSSSFWSLAARTGALGGEISGIGFPNF